MTTKLFTAYQVHPRNSEIRKVMGVPAGEPLRLYVQARGKRDALRVLAELGESRLRSTDLEETTPRRSDDFQKELKRQFLPPENVVYYAKADVDVPVVRLRLVGRIGIPAVDVAGYWRRIITEGRHHYAFDRADPEVFLPDPKDPAVMAAVDRALAAGGLRAVPADEAVFDDLKSALDLGGTVGKNLALDILDDLAADLGHAVVPATCTCLHPGWPETLCRLHPEARPRTREEGAKFAADFDEHVRACRAARTPTQQRMYDPAPMQAPAPVEEALPQVWITDQELREVINSTLDGEAEGLTMGAAMKAVMAVVGNQQDQKLIHRLVKDYLG